jgi:hypothetical protein
MNTNAQRATDPGAPVAAGRVRGKPDAPASGGGMVVRLVVNSKGDVVAVTDRETGKKLSFVISMNWDDSEDAPALFEALASKVSTSLHGSCGRSCAGCAGRGCLAGLPVAALSSWKRNAAGCLVVVPLFNCRVDSVLKFPTGAAYVLPADLKPKHSFFPFNSDYCSGMTLVELENKLDERGLMLTTDYFTTKDALRRRDMFIALAYGDTDPDALPGVVLHDTLKDLVPFTSSKYPRDPLLRTFLPNWKPSPGVRLGADDYCFIGSSTWGDVSAATREVAGHATGQVHFYMVVKYALPPELVDQIVHVVYTNPKNDNWQAFAERKVFERTHALAERIREHFVDMALHEMGLQRKKSTPDAVHTNWNVLDSAAIQVRASSADAGAATGVCFYSGCTPTHLARRGVVVPRGPDADSGALWFHGEPSGFVGGRSWKQPSSVSAFPCALGKDQKWTKRELQLLAEAGWDANNGFVKIDALVRLKL